MKPLKYSFQVTGRIACFCLLITSAAQAQSIRTDSSTPTTFVGDCNTSCTITGGTAADQNLFHSFSRFNVKSGATVLFSDPGVENILGRVTGDVRSEIRGTLGVEGNANLFLINPHGVLFGAGASLDVKGSFIATTANAIQFGDRGFLTTAATDAPSPTLTVNPSAFLLNQVRNQQIGSIELRGFPSLEVPKGQRLLLVGGNVNLDGGRLYAPAGRVELGGLAAAGTIELNADRETNLLSLSFPDNIAWADISLVAAVVDVGGDGGSLAINANTIEITEGSDLKAGIFDADSAQAGDITLRAGDIEIVSSSISNEEIESSQAAGGDINIQAKALSLGESSQIRTSAFEGTAGNVLVNVDGSVSLTEGSKIFTNTSGQVSAGDIRISADSLSLEDEAALNANTFGQGKAGSVTLQIDRIVSLTNHSRIFAGAELGLASDAGTAGDILVQAEALSLSNNSELSTDTSGRDFAGNITLILQDSLLLRNNSQITTTARGTGNGGNIRIDTDVLIGLENSDIFADANEGRGGFIQITADGIFGIEPREERSDVTSDITANSQQNPELDGVVEINASETAPDEERAELPQEVINVAQLIDQNLCASGEDSQLTVSGRGGLPRSPSQLFSPDNTWEDWRIADERPVPNQSAAPQLTEPTRDRQQSTQPTVEAQGWRMVADGTIALTAEPNAGSRPGNWLPPSGCQRSTRRLLF